MDTPEYQRHSKCRLKTTVFVGASQQDMHGEYADKQLVNLQKRIFLIEFLHLGLVIVYQGTYPLPLFINHYECGAGIYACGPVKTPKKTPV